MSLVGSVGIGALGLLIVADVVGRNLFNQPIVGTLEVAKASVVVITFLTLPYAMRRGYHVRSTVLISRLGHPAANFMLALSGLAGATVFGLIAYASLEPMVFAIQSGEFVGEGARHIPTAPTRIVIVLGAAVMSLECLLEAFMRRNKTSSEGVAV